MTRFHHWDMAYYKWYQKSLLRQLRCLSGPPDAVLLHNDLVSPKYVKKAIPTARVVVDLQNEQRTRRRDRQSIKQAVHMFVACSRHIRDWTLKEHQISPTKVVIINNGVDEESFRPRDGHLCPRDTLEVLFIGRIDRNKGPDIVADAVAKLRSEGLSINLTVAGGLWFYGHGNEDRDPFFQDLSIRMKKASARYLGHVVRADVPALIREHDVVCVLSRANDPDPLVCLEAMASGCAVVQ